MIIKKNDNMFYDISKLYNSFVNVYEPSDITGDKYVKRYENNPVLTAEDIPYDATMVFNAGITKYHGKYVMVFRNDWGDLHTLQGGFGSNMGLAFSDDGINWDVQPEPCFEWHDRDILHAYDPRLTVIDGRCYLCFATTTKQGLRGGIAVTDDFENFEILSLTAPDNRNLVLFPEKINGNFMRLERPFPMYGMEGMMFDIWSSQSPDMRYWGDNKLVVRSREDVPFSNSKIGPGASPVKTDKGWLTFFHVTNELDTPVGGWETQTGWSREYLIGVMLLDLEDPSKVVGMYKHPLMTPQPEYPYECDGFRNNVLFPTAAVPEDDGTIKIYYGAADTVLSLATADIDTLVKLCLEQ